MTLCANCNQKPEKKGTESTTDCRPFCSQRCGQLFAVKAFNAGYRIKR